MSTARMTLPAAEPVADIFDQLRHASGLLTAHELSQLLRLSPKTLYSYAERDLIPHFKIESSIRFCGMEVAEWLRSRRHSAQQQLHRVSICPHG